MTVASVIVIDEKLERLYELLEDVEVTTLTTRRADGALVSRPMATQRRAEGAHFWFVTSHDASKLTEIERDPNVNLAYDLRRTRAREWVSVSGVARISRDPSKIRELYEPSWRSYFPEEKGRRNGGPEDPRIVLLGVEARSAHVASIGRPNPVVLFDRLKGPGSLVERVRLGESETAAPDGV